MVIDNSTIYITYTWCHLVIYVRKKVQHYHLPVLVLELVDSLDWIEYCYRMFSCPSTYSTDYIGQVSKIWGNMRHVWYLVPISLTDLLTLIPGVVEFKKFGNIKFSPRSIVS